MKGKYRKTVYAHLVELHQMMEYARYEHDLFFSFPWDQAIRVVQGEGYWPEVRGRDQILMKPCSVLDPTLEDLNAEPGIVREVKAEG